MGTHWLPPEKVPSVINRRQGDPFWKVLGEAGKHVRVMRMPVTFPPEPFPHGEMLSGLGTPDLSGRIGKPFYFTSELFFQPRGGNEVSIEIVELEDNKGTLADRDQGSAEQALPEAVRLHPDSDDDHGGRGQVEGRHRGLGREARAEAGRVEPLGALRLPLQLR